MTNEEIKAIYEYMGFRWKFDHVDRPFDSNSAWECVQEMERKKEWGNFKSFCHVAFVTGLDVNEWLKKDFTAWLYNPTNFFDCFGKWCLERRGK